VRTVTSWDLLQDKFTLSANQLIERQYRSRVRSIHRLRRHAHRFAATSLQLANNNDRGARQFLA
jgi:hypothetical protein